MDLVKAPNPVAAEQVLTKFTLEARATPPAGTPSYEEYEGVAGLGAVSPGQTAWLVLPDLEPGTYVTSCFMPDEHEGAPHIFLGMVQVFDVGEAGTPTA